MSDRLGRILTDEDHHYATDYATVARSVHDSHRQRETATLQVRRVIPSGRSEELQIEISVETYYKDSNRITAKHSSLVLSAADADRLAEACAKLRNPVEAVA